MIFLGGEYRRDRSRSHDPGVQPGSAHDVTQYRATCGSVAHQLDANAPPHSVRAERGHPDSEISPRVARALS